MSFFAHLLSAEAALECILFGAFWVAAIVVGFYLLWSGHGSREELREPLLSQTLPNASEEMNRNVNEQDAVKVHQPDVYEWTFMNETDKDLLICIIEDPMVLVPKNMHVNCDIAGVARADLELGQRAGPNPFQKISVRAKAGCPGHNVPPRILRTRSHKVYLRGGPIEYSYVFKYTSWYELVFENFPLCHSHRDTVVIREDMLGLNVNKLVSGVTPRPQDQQELDKAEASRVPSCFWWLPGTKPEGELRRLCPFFFPPDPQSEEDVRVKVEAARKAASKAASRGAATGGALPVTFARTILHPFNCPVNSRTAPDSPQRMMTAFFAERLRSSLAKALKQRFDEESIDWLQVVEGHQTASVVVQAALEQNLNPLSDPDIIAPSFFSSYYLLRYAAYPEKKVLDCEVDVLCKDNCTVSESLLNIFEHYEHVSHDPYACSDRGEFMVRFIEKDEPNVSQAYFLVAGAIKRSDQTLSEVSHEVITEVLNAVELDYIRTLKRVRDVSSEPPDPTGISLALSGVTEMLQKAVQDTLTDKHYLFVFKNYTGAQLRLAVSEDHEALKAKRMKLGLAAGVAQGEVGYEQRCASEPVVVIVTLAASKAGGVASEAFISMETPQIYVRGGPQYWCVWERHECYELALNDEMFDFDTSNIVALREEDICKDIHEVWRDVYPGAAQMNVTVAKKGL